LVLSNRLLQTLWTPPCRTCTWLQRLWTQPCEGSLCCVCRSFICKQPHNSSAFLSKREAHISM
jgi:hypothetical protein